MLAPAVLVGKQFYRFCQEPLHVAERAAHHVCDLGGGYRAIQNSGRHIRHNADRRVADLSLARKRRFRIIRVADEIRALAWRIVPTLADVIPLLEG